MTRMISFFVLLAIIIVLGVLSFEVLSSFLLPIFIAVLLVVMFRPVHEWFLRRCKGRVRVAAGLTTLAILLIVLLPMLWILARAATETVALVTELKEEDLLRRITTVRQHLKLEAPPEALQKKLADIEATLHRVDESATFSLNRPDRAEAELRRLWIKDLEDWTGQLGTDIEALGPGQDESPDAIARQKELSENYDALRTAIAAIGAAEAVPADVVKASARAEDTLARLKKQLLGSPLMVWLKSQANLDKDQLSALQTKLKELIGPLALGTTQYVGSFMIELIVGLTIMIISLYYFLADGPAMVSSLMRLSPLDDRYEQQLLTEFGSLTRAVIVAMLLAASIQGLLAGIGYFLVGFGSIFLLTVLSMLFAMVPFIGATAVWGACCLWLLVHDGRPHAAIGLAVYGTLVVSLADNLIKPMVLHGRSNLHPLLALLSVLGGAKALGPIGIVVGPMIVAFLQTLLVMLRTEMTAMDARPQKKDEG
jgi:predicted PurR-regulated permease PerM